MRNKKIQKKPSLERLQYPFLSETTYISPGTWRFHYHDYIELELIVEGKGYQIFNGIKFDLSAGDIYVLKMADSHMIHSDGMVLQKYIIREDLLSQWLLFTIYSLNNPTVVHLSEEDFGFVYSAMKNAQKTYSLQDEISRQIATSLIELPFMYLLKYAGVEKPEKKEDSFYNILFFIQNNDNFLQPLTLESVASEFHYSASYFSKLFHRKFGKSFKEYLIFLRIEHAKKLLITTDLPVAEICIRSGFSSFPNFLTMFKRQTGLSPTAYKRHPQP